MITLTRPEGAKTGDLNLSRRGVAAVFFAGYAAAAVSAQAEPIHTDETGLVTATVTLPTAGKQIPAYVARPAAPGRHPAVIVVSEVFGVHEYIRDVARRLAKQGYVAIAPALFDRAGDPAPLTDFPAIMKIVNTATDAQVQGDIAATIRWLRAQPFTGPGKIGITGFCWGGGETWMAAATHPEIGAAVAWYGRVAVPAKPAETDPARRYPLQVVGALKAPVLGLYGGKDQGIPVADVEAMRAALKAKGSKAAKASELVVYPQAQHGFHADYRPSYDPEAAADGWKRMLAFFKAHGVG